MNEDELKKFKQELKLLLDKYEITLDTDDRYDCSWMKIISLKDNSVIEDYLNIDTNNLLG